MTLLISRLPASTDAHFSSTSQSICAEGNDSRNACTAGSVWMISPSALIRRTRKRFSAMAGTPDPLNQSARRMFLRIPDNRHANPESRCFIALRHGLRRVIRALGVHIRKQFAQQRAHIRLVENHHVIHGLQRADKFRAIRLRHNWTPHSLQLPRARIGIDGHHENIAFVPRSLQITHMPCMQHIETPVREHDFLPLCFVLRDPANQLRARQNLRTGVHEFALASLRTALSSSARDTVAVPRFITTIPPAKFARCAASTNEPPAARASVNTAITVSPAPVTSTASSPP